METIKLSDMVKTYKNMARVIVKEAYRNNYTNEILLEDALYKACGQIREQQEKICYLLGGKNDDTRTK